MMGLPFPDRRVIRVGLVALFLFIAWETYSSLYTHANPEPIQPNTNHPPYAQPPGSNNPCRNPDPALEDVLVVFRTGATESESKLPVHFETTLRCIPHWVVYSDFNEQVEGHEIHDALDEISDQVKQQNSDFELYNRLRQDGRGALDAAELESWAKAKNTPSGNMGNPAWKLDKWKFLPIVDKALVERPEAKWFIFAEADTYLHWPALMQWLALFDHNQPHYLGNQMQIGDVIFGHGGSGFIVSNPAMHMFSQQRSEHMEEYDALTAENWAGDCVLGKVFADAGVEMTWSWPNLVGDFAGIDYATEAWDKRLWCHNAVSHHHMSPQEVRDFWSFEQAWYNNKLSNSLLRHKDIFEFFVIPRLRKQRDDWDNLANTVYTNQPIDSFEACGKACEDLGDCLQYSFVDGECRVANVTLLGHESLDKTKSSRSGWMLDRIEMMVRGLRNCDRDEWVLP